MLSLLLVLAGSPEEDLIAGVEAALQNESQSAARMFDRANDPAAKGLAALLGGNRAVARALLATEPKLAVYLAMAQVDGPGGIGRARETLSKATPSPGVDFLLALAFRESGQAKQADEHLKRSVETSGGGLDEAFAPDPAVALVRWVLPKVSKAGKARLARALVGSGRRAEAILVGDRDVKVEVWTEIDPRRALKHATNPGQRARLHHRLGEKKKTRDNLDKAESEDPGVMHLRVEMLLEDGKAEQALDIAQDAARLAPKSDAAPYWVARALFAAGQHDRAHAFATELLRRKPMTIDPYGILADIQRARGREREVKALELRSTAHREEQKKIARARRRREAVIAAVRDAEDGLGITGLDAVRTADPTYALPVDIAIARLGRGGVARAARDRILSTCGGRLRLFLQHQGTWDEAVISVSPYGRAVKAHASLSAADPGRCGGRVLRK